MTRTLAEDVVCGDGDHVLPRLLMQRVRAQVDAAGVPATALVRGWVADRLVAQETGDIGRDQLVAALRSVLADLDPIRAHLVDSA